MVIEKYFRVGDVIDISIIYDVLSDGARGNPLKSMNDQCTVHNYSFNGLVPSGHLGING